MSKKEPGAGPKAQAVASKPAVPGVKQYEARLPNATPQSGTFVGPDGRGFFTSDCGCRWNRLAMYQCRLHAAAHLLAKSLSEMMRIYLSDAAITKRGVHSEEWARGIQALSLADYGNDIAPKGAR
jgi:hypothetical protein